MYNHEIKNSDVYDALEIYQKTKIVFEIASAEHTGRKKVIGLDKSGRVLVMFNEEIKFKAIENDENIMRAVNAYNDICLY